MPHQSLQMRAHPWGADESGWSPEDDGGRQHPSKLNGFSAYRPKMSAWQFFEASPAAARSDWRGQLFDHQANYFRYLIARWGYSRSLGVWVIVDELDAVGDALGHRAGKRGWWAHPQASRWLADVVRLFRGVQKRRDGLRYGGDPYRHPIHAATTSSDGRIDRDGNLDWPGGPAGARVDLLGWHWYPTLAPKPDDAAWLRSIDGIISYAAGALPGKARLISEFGLPDRSSPDEAPSIYYPTLYHHALWASIFAGHAGSAMDWDDGKEFGELRWRRAKGPVAGSFVKSRYPIDKTESVVALRRFLAKLSPDGLVRCGKTVSGSKGLRVLALCDRKRHAAYGWVFVPRASKRRELRFGAPLAKGRYKLTFFDPWTGKPIASVPPQTVSVDSASGAAAVATRAAFARLRQHAKGLPRRLRVARGRDLAFKLLRASD
jgi:hypothetical protein